METRSRPDIRPLPREAVVELVPSMAGIPAVAHAGVHELDDGRLEVRGFGGLMWRADRCWLWFVRLDGEASHPIVLVRAAKKMLKRAVQLGEPAVYAWRDDRMPSSKRLLEVLGFEFMSFESGVLTDGAMDVKEVWRWVIQSRGL